MTTTDAQKRAEAKYRKEKVVQKVVRFYPSDNDLLMHVEDQENFQGYIKALIRSDMEKQETQGGA